MKNAMTKSIRKHLGDVDDYILYLENENEELRVKNAQLEKENKNLKKKLDGKK